MPLAARSPLSLLALLRPAQSARLTWQSGSASHRAALPCGPPRRPQLPGWDTESPHSKSYLMQAGAGAGEIYMRGIHTRGTAGGGHVKWQGEGLPRGGALTNVCAVPPTAVSPRSGCCPARTCTSNRAQARHHTPRWQGRGGAAARLQHGSVGAARASGGCCPRCLRRVTCKLEWCQAGGAAASARLPALCTLD